MISFQLIYMEEFKNLIKDYIAMDEQQKELGKQMKQVKENKDQMTEVIKKHMIKNNIDMYNLPDERMLVLKNQLQLSAINKELIQDTLSEYFKQPQHKGAENAAEKATEFILSNRESKEKCVLRILKKK